MPSDRPGTWVTAAEMGDYAFCPRAQWYARTRGAGGPTDPRALAGERYHADALAAVRSRDSHRGAYALTLLLALAGAAVVALLLLGRS